MLHVSSLRYFSFTEDDCVWSRIKTNNVPGIVWSCCSYWFQDMFGAKDGARGGSHGKCRSYEVGTVQQLRTSEILPDIARNQNFLGLIDSLSSILGYRTSRVESVTSKTDKERLLAQKKWPWLWMKLLFFRELATQCRARSAVNAVNSIKGKTHLIGRGMKSRSVSTQF